MRHCNIITAVVVAAAAVLLASCDHKELCYSHPHRAGVRVVTDWQDFIPFERPSGMTVMVYPEDGIEETKTLLSNDISHVDAALYEGKYKILAYNQSPEEFAYVSFENMDNFETALVRSATYNSRWYSSRAGDSRVADEPEWVGCDSHTGVVVTPEMLTSDTITVIDSLRPQDIIYNVKVNILADGAAYIGSVRASLDGMAEGYWLGLLKPTGTTVTQLMEKWQRTRVTRSRTRADGEEEIITDSILTTTIKSFGLPANHEAKPADNTLTIDLMLVDGETKLSHEFAVGDIIHLSETEPMTLVVDVKWPEKIPFTRPKNSSYFDISVDDWGEETEVDLFSE